MKSIDIEIENTIAALQSQKVILYPTDTVWGIGCDARNSVAVERIFQIKKRDPHKPMLCIVSDIEMLKQYVEVTPTIESYLKNVERPTTVIYPNAQGLASNLVAKNGSIAIRVVNDLFCTSLVKQFGAPIVSTSANISNHITPMTFEEIEESILEGVDYIVNLQTEKKSQSPSRLIQITEDGSIICLRE